METEVLSESDIVRSESDIIRTVGSEVTMGVAQTVSEEICGLSHLSRTTTDRLTLQTWESFLQKQLIN